MKKVRLGIIGIGGMGSGHVKNILNGLVPSVELTAVCDVNPARLEFARQNWPESIQKYDNADAFFADAPVDAVLIATPHYFHPVYSIQAMKKGLHVMSEKPVGVYTKAIHEVNELAESSGLVYGAMFVMRTYPVYKKVRELVQDGALGEMKRTVWINTDWYRTQAYYNNGGWRATWEGEGGGVLLNQCPHQLDLWQWMCGMPQKVRAFMQFGKCRDIQVENEVTAYTEYENGASGIFIAATHEAPGTNRLEISGDRGKILVEDNVKLTFWENLKGEKEFNRDSVLKGGSGFGAPECWKQEVPVEPWKPGHSIILENFAQAILNGAKLIAPGTEGIRGLTLSNAMHLSAWTDSVVDTGALDEDLFYELLQKHIADAKAK